MFSVPPSRYLFLWVVFVVSVSFIACVEQLKADVGVQIKLIMVLLHVEIHGIAEKGH